MNSSEIKKLLQGVNFKELSDKDKLDFLSLFENQEDEVKKILFEDLNQIVTSKIDEEKVQFNKIYNRLKTRILKKENESYGKKKVLINLARIAAIFIIAFLLAGAIFFNYIRSQTNTGAFTEVNVPLGAKSNIILPDGSTVNLNAGSKITYPVNFLKGKREVYLEGEAFFDVKHIKNKLFVVKTSSINIKVFGTQFNVKSYPEENLIKTTLIKGSVAIEPVSGEEAGKTIYLKPNQTAIYYKSTDGVYEKSENKISGKDEKEKLSETVEKIVVASEANPLPITSWKDDRWIIDAEELGVLAVKLERRYNVKISFDNESLKSYKFNGTLTDETFEQVLKVIQLSAPIKFEIEGNLVKFREDLLYKRKYDKMISNN